MKVKRVLIAAAAGLTLASVTAQITLASQPRNAKPGDRKAVPLERMLIPDGAPRLEMPQADYRRARKADDWTTHSFALFTIQTPAGWSAKGPVKNLYDAEHGTYFFEDGVGNFFAVNIDPYGSDFGADSVWRYAAGPDSVTVNPPAADCTPSEEDPFCTVGDGRLDLYSVTASEDYGSSDIKGHYYYFAFGNTKSESADRAVFERILESMRVR